MAKQKTVYSCTSCGLEQPKWLGKCPDCGEWNTFIEHTPSALDGGAKKNPAKRVPKAEALTAEQDRNVNRLLTGVAEFDRVLGGGFVKNSAVLIGGEPGIGKSTLLLQLTGAMPESVKVLYITGEESTQQIRIRAGRLGSSGTSTLLMHAAEIDDILRTLDKEQPHVLFIDSIQTLISSELGAVPGTVNQIKYCAYELIGWARENDGVAVFIAHVTKEGSIAGPKVIEHMVDAVLYFEHGAGDLRIIRSMKNRFGSTQEIGLFTMENNGLIEVSDPSRFLLGSRSGSAPPGVVIAAVYEGSRVLLVEIQALVVPSQGSVSRVFSEGVDKNKISRLAAVCEKHLHMRFSDQDLYINIGGGLKINEVGIDLPLAMALYSARTDLPVPLTTVVSGEVSLTGEIRKTPYTELRYKTAVETGFTAFVSPQSGSGGQSAPGGNGQERQSAWHRVATIQEAINSVFS